MMNLRRMTVLRKSSESYTGRASKWRLHKTHHKKSCDNHSEMCISQIGLFLGLIGLTENFTIRAPNCCCDDKHNRTRSKRSVRGVSEHFAK